MGGLDQIRLGEDGDKWQAVVNTVMNFQVALLNCSQLDEIRLVPFWRTAVPDLR